MPTPDQAAPESAEDLEDWLEATATSLIAQHGNAWDALAHFIPDYNFEEFARAIEAYEEARESEARGPARWLAIQRSLAHRIAHMADTDYWWDLAQHGGDPALFERELNDATERIKACLRFLARDYLKTDASKKRLPGRPGKNAERDRSLYEESRKKPGLSLETVGRTQALPRNTVGMAIDRHRKREIANLVDLLRAAYMLKKIPSRN